MKNYDLSLQRKQNWCVPSCVQAILRYEGIEISQKKIYKKLTKVKSGDVLINDKKIEKLFKKKGFNYKYYFYNKTLFNKQDELLNDISNDKNHCIIGFDFHAYLLEEFKQSELKLLDPKNSQIIKRDLFELNFEMHEKSQGIFGLAKKIY